VARKKFRYNFNLVIGISLLLFVSLWRFNRVRILSFNTASVTVSSGEGVTPVYVKSYPLGIDISLTPTEIVNGVWQIPPEAAAYLGKSGKIGGGSNIIIYGHNRNSILGPIRWISQGSVIELTGSDNKIYKYSVISTDEVDADNLSYIQNTEEEILTIYTCSGFLDSKRFVVRAKALPVP
jgi:LPXTG-site transpeptidase (sortase) family protein